MISFKELLEKETAKTRLTRKLRTTKADFKDRGKISSPEKAKVHSRGHRLAAGGDEHAEKQKKQSVGGQKELSRKRSRAAKKPGNVAKRQKGKERQAGRNQGIKKQIARVQKKINESTSMSLYCPTSCVSGE